MREYGEWHRLGLANGHLADMVAASRRAGRITVGLLGNCSSLMGMLGGLQHSGPDDVPRTVTPCAPRSSGWRERPT